MSTFSRRFAGVLSVTAALAVPQLAHAVDLDVYGGVGLPGATLGLRVDMGHNLAARLEQMSSRKIDESGVTEGVDYNATARLRRTAVLLDWHPFAGGFRVTGGLSFNKMAAQFVARGGVQTINDKTINLTGRLFQLDAEFPNTTPYLGLGWTSKANGDQPGIGFHADVGVHIGKFKASSKQNIVGQGGITQADVDAETAQLQDKLNRLSALPSASLGVSYRF
jgi:hypothetical protein